MQLHIEFIANASDTADIIWNIRLCLKFFPQPVDDIVDGLRHIVPGFIAPDIVRDDLKGDHTPAVGD